MQVLTLYKALIEEQHEGEAFIQVYWARADEIGAAIEMMLAASLRNGLMRPKPRELTEQRSKIVGYEVEPSVEADVFWGTSRLFFPAELVFDVPYGVIPSFECSHEPDSKESIDISAGYTRVRDNAGKTTIEVNVEQDDLLPLYERFLRACDSYKVFWYLLHDHWEDRGNQFLVNENLNTPEKILRHIREHELDSLRNGFVTLASYRAEGDTNLNISDHKRIVVSTFSDSAAAEYISILKECEYSEDSNLISIDCEMHHWHYRHPKSLSREGLMNHLRAIGFSDWKPKEGG